ncbi:protealysin inhibitor emfourin [Naasia sp. SYSU D00948]|uniref:protealysin inhibitor emfourin n=1 Tax=Naasia sp. SYSU D00948 TaxID=2817379 RepID=UPI001B3104D4|nr:protealysin inhibitor emfourin [Naasia sp. SYSU D00948]
MIVVTVSRSGGIAGITRRWTVSLGEADWEDLLSRAGTDPAGRDRFVYRVTDGRRSAVIPDSRLDARLRRLLSGLGEAGDED